jgi:hypothetical protein
MNTITITGLVAGTVRHIVTSGIANDNGLPITSFRLAEEVLGSDETGKVNYFTVVAYNYFVVVAYNELALTINNEVRFKDCVHIVGRVRVQDDYVEIVADSLSICG